MSAPQNVTLNSPLLDVIVLGARTVEREVLIEEFANAADNAATDTLRREKNSSVEFPIFALPTKAKHRRDANSFISVGIMECAEMGNVSAAINTSIAIVRYEPRLIIFAGIAGSLDSKTLRVGDVVLPRRVKTRYFQKFKTFDEDYAAIPFNERHELIESIKGKLFINDHSVDVNGGRRVLSRIIKNDLEREIEDISIPEEWVSTHQIPNRRTNVVLVEEMFSWDHVLSNKGYVQFLQAKLAGAWTAVDMESYGFLRAVEKLRMSNFVTDGIVVRAISDFAEHKELSDSEPKWRQLGLRNMAIASRYIVQSVYDNAY